MHGAERNRPREAEAPADGRGRGDGGGDLHGAEHEDRAAQPPQALRIELQPHQEQQQHDADLAEAQHRLGLRDQCQAPGSDCHARGEKAEHRAQAEALEDRHGDNARGEIDECLIEESVFGHAVLR
jgi:hypothetical protein